jgi:hypothetical protein
MAFLLNVQSTKNRGRAERAKLAPFSYLEIQSPVGADELAMAAKRYVCRSITVA